MAESIWGQIFTHLSTGGMQAYPPAQKVGECTEPYVVVKDDGASAYRNVSSTINYYTIMCYVPKETFSSLEPFVEQVKGIMKGLKPMVMPTDLQTPSFYDDTYKAYMISIQYRNFKKS